MRGSLCTQTHRPFLLWTLGDGSVQRPDAGGIQTKLRTRSYATQSYAEQAGQESKMESNRDEAEKCLEIGKKYLRTGEIDRAKRILEKCLRLFPLKDAACKYWITEKRRKQSEVLLFFALKHVEGSRPD